MGALLLREYQKGIIHGGLAGLLTGLFWSGAWLLIKSAIGAL